MRNIIYTIICFLLLSAFVQTKTEYHSFFSDWNPGPKGYRSYFSYEEIPGFCSGCINYKIYIFENGDVYYKGFGEELEIPESSFYTDGLIYKNIMSIMKKFNYETIKTYQANTPSCGREFQTDAGAVHYEVSNFLSVKNIRWSRGCTYGRDIKKMEDMTQEIKQLLPIETWPDAIEGIY